VSAGAFSLPEHDFGIPAVAALSFILGRMPRECQRISSDFAQARWDLRFLVIPSSIALEEQHNEHPTAGAFMFDQRSR
jgi:hypothetical protein